jgi:septum formation topological specificity factor MinE
VDEHKVQVNLERGDGMSTLAIGIELPGNGTARRNAAA